MKQLVLPIETRPEPTFDDFLAGPNRLAVEQLQALVGSAATPACDAPNAAPWYLWGGAGTGKTHLLRALAGCFRQQGALVGWFQAADPLPWQLADDDLQPVQPGASAAGKRTLVVLDGCDDFGPQQQQAAFSLFVEAAVCRGCVIVASGRLPPVDLAVREDLRTRLGWGHVLALEPLSEADTRCVLRAAAKARGLSLADEVADYLLARFARDLSNLMWQIDRLDRFALQTRRAISLAMLRDMLADAAAT